MGLAKDIFGPDQIAVDVGDNDIEIVTRNRIPVVETTVDNISISEVTFGEVALWLSGLIKTETPVVSVEVRADTTIPVTDEEILKFFISFDNEKFYQVRNVAGSVDAFNISYPTRIVLNNDNLVDEYLYLPSLGEQRGIYLRVEMGAAETNRDTPVIWNLTLKIKTEQIAE